jgi:hypothetical protein
MMTSGVGIIGTVPGIAATQSATAPVAPPVATSAPAATAVPLAPQVLSPTQRIVFDPQAGLIDQYLNSKGNLESQIPSSVVVAYLRAGLTADGLTKQQAANAARGQAVA